MTSKSMCLPWLNSGLIKPALKEKSFGEQVEKFEYELWDKSCYEIVVRVRAC